MKQIKEMSKDKNPWIRRIAIVSNLPLIRKNKIEFALMMSEYLIYDEDIYVQKGVGWILREIGKKDRITLRNFILNHLDMKPYTFSYATERCST
jgi:3-methyladenine DNA glycosylase AlkD